ncbi:lipid droplet assembly factor 1-A-like [Neosynchiropus ocellatus]
MESSGVSEQLRESWVTLSRDPRVSQLLSSRVGRYLTRHPPVALALLLFSVLSAPPVGLFLAFACVSILISFVGFVFFQVVLLFGVGVTLLSVLSGLAIFSVMTSVMVTVSYFTVANILNYFHPHSAAEVQEEDSVTKN